MTDGENQDLEPGSTLPVPAACDGHSPDSEVNSQNPIENDVNEGEDWFAVGDGVDGSTLECPPEHQDQQELHDLDDDGKRHGQFTAATASSMDQAVPGHERALNETESKMLDSMVNQAILSASLNDGLELPWEKGIMACIFGDEPLAAVPKIPAIAHSMDDRKTDQAQSVGGSLEPHAKRQRTCNTTLRLYERAIRFKNNLTDHEADEAKWNRAIEKLYAVILSGPGVVPDGVRFQEGHMDLNFRQSDSSELFAGQEVQIQ